jgi:hypothetical protein
MAQKRTALRQLSGLTVPVLAMSGANIHSDHSGAPE